jgi:hypothetical protein
VLRRLFTAPAQRSASHADGNGLNVLLQALPINSTLALRPSKKRDGEAEQPVANKKRRNERRGR